MEIKRDVLGKLLTDLKEKYITILIGARQVGKTFLLRKVESEAKSRGLKTAFFDLEQPETLTRVNISDAAIVSMLLESGDVIFIDEFHYLKNASRIFKAIYDRGGQTKIFASGSSSLAIHKHLKESLAGRKLVYQINPCSFREISQLEGKDNLDHYCRYGGLPGLINFEDEEKKRALLTDILQSYLLKDIKSLIREENIRAFNNMLFLLAQYQGSIVTSASLAKEIGLTARTIDSYLDILAQTYVNFPLYSFSQNYGNELKKSKKYYLYDLGIRNALIRNFAPLADRKDAGIIAESFVFLELQKRLSPESEIRFWRLKDGTEVDFIWIKNQRPYPIEVKLSCRPGEIPAGIKAFLRKYQGIKLAFVVNQAQEGEVIYQGAAIRHVRLTAAGSIPDFV
jgi:predicted AAA+ superfamily ATPase